MGIINHIAYVHTVQLAYVSPLLTARVSEALFSHIIPNIEKLRGSLPARDQRVPIR